MTEPRASGAGAPDSAATDVVLEVGWGRLVFGQTFADQHRLGDVLRDEASGQRDIAVYLDAPHVLVAAYPQEYFIDPSHTMRLDLDPAPEAAEVPFGTRIEPARTREQLERVTALYVANGLVAADVDVMHANLERDDLLHLLAIDDESGEVIGTVIGVDHVALFGDPQGGSSLWSLAVDLGTARPGVGSALTRTLAAAMATRGRRFLDLSVMHDNAGAIKLYESLGFRRVPVLAVKRKNAINQPLFTVRADDAVARLGPYARIIADEAARRGIRVSVLDADTGYLELEHAGRTVITRESLSQYTTAVAMSRCDDKRVTRKVVEAAGVRVPRGRTASFDDGDREFLREVGSLAVKPARGEQGAGISLGVSSVDELEAALARAGGAGTEILLEEFCEGDDLRVLVIDGRVVAAAVRRPAEVLGDGEQCIRELIAARSRRRERASGGESTIPLDAVTELTVQQQGWSFDDVLPRGERLQVRRTANLHTGGTIHDVTAKLHPALADAAVRAATAIDIPVTGIDLLVPDVEGPDYVFIEANERPGLANHEPQPVVEAFVDYLFPDTKRLGRG